MITQEQQIVLEQNFKRIVGSYSDVKNGTLTVAVVGGGGDWAAYRSASAIPAQVARLGDKITGKEACALFPWLNPETWRF